MRRIAETTALGLLTAVCVTAPAFAGLAATPAPVIGLGIPALAAFGFAYRRLRNRKEG